jgi:hypothetical protein
VCLNLKENSGAKGLNNGKKICMVTFIVGDGVDGVTIRHRMDGPGFEHPVGIRHLLFSTPVQYGPGAQSDFSTLGTKAPSWGVKRSGPDFRQPSPSIERQQ